MPKTVKWVSTSAEKQWTEMHAGSFETAEPTLKLTGERLQSIRGFGGCFNELGWVALTSLKETDRKAILHSFFDPKDGCAFNLCRLPIGASDYALEWYSLDEHDGDYEMLHFSVERDESYLIPYIHEALKLNPGIELFASPWSPPVWMKHPKAYNYGQLIWETKNLEAYALYFLKFVQAYQTHGIRIQQIHVQNEPVADQKFPSCLWSGEQLRDFIKLYLGPLFVQKSPGTQIWLGTINAPSSGDYLHTDYDYYANTVLSDTDAKKYISGVGYQWGGKHAIQRTHESWPELPLLQTENECGDGENTWDYACYVFSLMKHYLYNGACGYVYWNMVLEPKGRSTWGWTQNTMVTVDPHRGDFQFNPEFYVMKHVSHFVRQRARLLSISGRSAGNTLAFENPDGQLVFVVMNPFRRESEFAVEARGGMFSVDLPPLSISTILPG